MSTRKASKKDLEAKIAKLAEKLSQLSGQVSAKPSTQTPPPQPKPSPQTPPPPSCKPVSANLVNFEPPEFTISAGNVR